ncbi:MAG: hypothetical protein IT548_09535 [Alphaproteobacteria bacterium]|nr:hypothetical protein [Alphaproteobacteria bacterium]
MGLALLGLSACASATMATAGPDLRDACVLEFGTDGRPKRVQAAEEPMQTIRIMNHDVKVRRVFGTRIVLRGRDAAAEPACSGASAAPNIG